ncbi:MAG: hypothetical protein K6E54_04035 [Bacteroidaceae bacterium]|nr:hypothetical protein [Bacteroidaceae bacterium]
MLALSSCYAFGQKAFKGEYHNGDLQLRMKLNLEDDNIPVPGLELDSCYGFLQGRINSSWIILKVKSVDDKKAIVRAMCEKGDAAQDIEITLTEGGIELQQIDGAGIKGIQNRKYVKLPKRIPLTKD